ncbi:hypothetical protein [Pseudomonas sp. S9]|uniref:hypothetical protein n=1 Tax=Pseudomonas sp. S9 TaxID=686578 RepID=UPI0002556F4D|nr:hypothetical protein [Pseudomonas sp. S9]
MAGLTKAQKAEKALLAKAVELSGVTAEEFADLKEEEQAGFIAKAQEAIDADEAEAKRLKDEADAAKEPQVDNSHLVKVAKDGEELEVHPACLADHKRLGWKEA